MIKLFHIDELEEDTSRGLEVDNQYLFAVKKDGQVYLYWNRCPHLGTPLEWEEDKFLDADNALIQCSTHGALFKIDDGECLVGPCQGKHLQSIPFSVEEDQIAIDPDVLRRPPPF